MAKKHSAPLRRELAEPQASSLPGTLPIIHDVRKAGRGIHGIPGIIESTTTGPEIRSRLLLGVIEHPMAGKSETHSAVSTVSPSATNYGRGMVHIRGSPF